MVHRCVVRQNGRIHEEHEEASCCLLWIRFVALSVLTERTPYPYAPLHL